MEEKRKKRSLIILTRLGYFFLPAVFMLSCMVIFGVAPFGDHSFVIIDGLHQYMPFYSVLYDKLREGGSIFYSFRIGMGVNFWSLLSYYLSSPLNLFILCFKKTQLNGAVSLLIAIKISLSGYFAGLYFSRKCKVPEVSLAAACLYALNSYVIGYSWNVMWLDVIMIFPMIMLGIEKLIREEDGRLYGFCLFYALYCNYYIAYMVCIFSVLWFFLGPGLSDLLEAEKKISPDGKSLYPEFIRQVLVRGLFFAFYSLLAAGMAAVLLIPAYLGIRQTASGGEMNLPVHGWLTGFADLLTRQFDLAMPISHDNFDGNINLYFGTATVITAFLYLLNQEISFMEKVKRVLLLVFLYVSFNEKILNYIWHGFHDQYGIPNRFSFLFGFVLICMFTDLLSHCAAIRAWHTVAACGAGLILLYLSRSLAVAPLDDPTYGIVGMMMLLYGGILLLMIIGRRKKRKKQSAARQEASGMAGADGTDMDQEVYNKDRAGRQSVKRSGVQRFMWKRNWYLSIFCAAAVLEICASAVMGYDTIGQIRISKFFSHTADMEEAADDLADGTFYRSELADARFVDESSWYRLHGVSLFGSTAMDKVVDLMDNLGFYTGCNEYLYEGANPVTNLMLDVRYQFFHPEDELMTEFEYEKNYGDMSLYQNPLQGLSPGYMINEEIDDWYYHSAYPFRVLNDFCSRGYGVDQVFETFETGEPLTRGCQVEKTNDAEYHFFYEEASDDNLIFTLPMKTDTDQLYIFYDGTQVEMSRIKVNGKTVVKGDLDGTMIYAGSVRAGSSVTVHLRLKGEKSDGYIRLTAASLNQSRFGRLARRMTRQAFKVTKWSDGHMEGNVSAARGQKLFFSIPSDRGWKILVDGRETEPEPVGAAFLSIPLKEGDHKISMRYRPPGFVTGAGLSIICWLIYLLICLPSPIRKRRKQKTALRRVWKLKKKRIEDARQ